MLFHSTYSASILARLVALLPLLLVVPACKAPEIARTLAGPDQDYAAYSTRNPAPEGVAQRAPAEGSPHRLPATGPPRRADQQHVIAAHEGPPRRQPGSGPPGPGPFQAQQVAYHAIQDELPGELPAPEREPDRVSAEPLPRPADSVAEGETLPIDLSTALRLGGANNLQIAFAAERVQAALARMDRADVMWVPSLNAGLVYNNHAGRIQATEGEVLEASRSSLFLGAGAGLGSSPLNAGSGGPARMFVDLPLVDVLFEPLSARQLVQAAEADQAATFNDTLLQITVAYLELLRAQARVGIAQEAVANAERLAKITEDFAQAGEGLRADAQRAQAELSDRGRDLLAAKESVGVASAELVRLLRMDPAVILLPVDEQVAPIEITPGDMPLRDLIGQALASRPEIARQDAFVEETWYRFRQEQWRPWMPHLYAGFSGGGFGGGMGGDVENFGDRGDFDVAALWQLQNFGLGNAARRREQDSNHLQAHIAADQFRDLVASQVSRSYHQVQYRRQQIDVARQQIVAASEALTLNFDGIRGQALRPIEAQQAITALADARQRYLDAVLGFNQAQFELLRALGVPPAPGAPTRS